MAARLGVVLAGLCLLLAAAAPAQEYQRVHVRSFTLSSDAARPQLEQPFHVVLTIRVAERVTQLRNVFLPTFFGAEELGDEQQIRHDAGGTTYRETLTLVAHASGTLSVSAAYFDAIDGRDGKAKRFISNSLQLPVGAGPERVLWETLRAIAFVVIDVVLVGAALFVVVVIFWRRRRVAARTPQGDKPQPLPLHVTSTPPPDEVAQAWRQLRERRDRASVLHLRAALWRAAGANSGETLSDVLRRPAAAQDRVRRLLTIVERAAFIEQRRLADAIEEVLCSPQ